MNKNLYLNVIVTLIFGTFLILGIVIVNALDHHRFAMEQLAQEVRKLEPRKTTWVPPLGRMRPLPATASQGKSPVPP